jgi:serine protease Do
MDEARNSQGPEKATGASDPYAGNPHADPWRSRKSGPGPWIAVVFLVAALVITVAIIQGAYRKSPFPTDNVPELPPPRAVTTAAPSPVELSNTFREVAKAVKPAVVYINVIERRAGSQDQGGGFFQFPEPRRREGAGSGFIVTPDGYILTNNHVVEGATKINVTLADGRKFKADVVGQDPNTDIAVIRIDAGDLPTSVLGDSDQVQQGDWVLALGSPFGLQQTLTAGIVSATGRELRDPQYQYNHYIQTDASINPGNSGGPLVNMQGEVVGINTMILAGGAFGGGNIGIGFAINSNLVRDIFPKLVSNGKVVRGYLGVSVLELDKPKAHALGLEAESGVFVADVPDPETPAGRAGIKAKDVIVSYDGKPVRMPRDLTDAVAATPVGQTVQVDFIREGQPQSVSVKVVERPANLTARFAPPQPDGDPRDDQGAAQQGRLGIQARTVTPEIAQQNKLKVDRGVFVSAVRPDGPAGEAGVRHGDVIHRIDRSEVATIEQLSEAVKNLLPGDYMLVVERQGRTVFLTLSLED